MNVNDIRNVESEAGIIASIIYQPEFTFYSEGLKPNHFTDPMNAYMYYAICELAKRGVEKVDAYNITNILNMKESTKKMTETLTIQAITDIIDISKVLIRSSVEEYKLLVDNVLNAAFRRDTYNMLTKCEQLCFDDSQEDIEHKIYQTLDGVMLEFSTTSEIPQFKDVVDSYWEEIQSRQGNGISGIPFKFPTLNKYATIEPGELFVFAAEAKQGKSMMLLNCAVDILNQGYSVLYIDSELNSRLFTCRLISHLTGIEFNRVKTGNYSREEQCKIDEAIKWIKSKKFTHKYLPMFDEQTIYTTVRKIKHTQGIDVLIIDYFKSSGDGDAFATYAELGRLVD